MNNMPSVEEIQEAIECINRLSDFEGQQRAIRGYGVFQESELPVKGLVKLIAWLKGEIGE